MLSPHICKRKLRARKSEGKIKIIEKEADVVWKSFPISLLLSSICSPDPAYLLTGCGKKLSLFYMVVGSCKTFWVALLRLKGWTVLTHPPEIVRSALLHPYFTMAIVQLWTHERYPHFTHAPWSANCTQQKRERFEILQFFPQALTCSSIYADSMLVSLNLRIGFVSDIIKLQWGRSCWYTRAR